MCSPFFASLHIPVDNLKVSMLQSKKETNDDSDMVGGCIRII